MSCFIRIRSTVVELSSFWANQKATLEKDGKFEGIFHEISGKSGARPCLVAPGQSPGIATAIDAVPAGSRSGSGEPAGGSLESLKVENG